jgi:hypothetical protein
MGLFLLVLASYVLTSPGRIDIIDGQVRFDITYNWLTQGRPIVRDPWVGPIFGVKGRNGAIYSYYGAPASVLSMPLVWVGLATGGTNIQPSQFLFSLTSTILGVGVAVILFLFYLELGVKMRAALAWTFVSSFATYLWPISNSTFDNAQHAFFALAAVYFGFLGARRRSYAWAALGGLTAGVLFLYQEYFLMIVPALALSTLDWSWRPSPAKETSSTPQSKLETGSISGRIVHSLSRTLRGAFDLLRAVWNGPGDTRSSFLRYCLFLAAVSVGIILSLAYNDLRFGTWLHTGKVRLALNKPYPLFGNPLAGFLTLLVSPGKNVFLYSPVLALAIAGIRGLWRRTPALVAAFGTTSLILVSFISCISFAAGDWCWGPRYLTLLLPLWALALPFVDLKGARRRLAIAIVGIGLVIQVMAVSVENQRFFFENAFNDYFWAEDPWAYFKYSALFHRVDEVISLRNGPPPTARAFNSIPIPNWCTYTVLGTPLGMDRSLAPTWMRSYQVYYLPKPWPLWMSYLPPAMRPIRIGPWIWSLLGMAVVGVGLVYRGWKEGTINE